MSNPSGATPGPGSWPGPGVYAPTPGGFPLRQGIYSPGLFHQQAQQQAVHLQQQQAQLDLQELQRQREQLQKELSAMQAQALNQTPVQQPGSGPRQPAPATQPRQPPQGDMMALMLENDDDPGPVLVAQTDGPKKTTGKPRNKAKKPKPDAELAEASDSDDSVEEVDEAGDPKGVTCSSAATA